MGIQDRNLFFSHRTACVPDGQGALLHAVFQEPKFFLFCFSAITLVAFICLV